MQPRLSLGQVTVTENAANVLADAGEELGAFLARHAQGDWGDISLYEKEEYDRGLVDGSREVFLSAYPLKTSQTIWVFTDLKQRKTTVMLPKEQVPRRGRREP